MTFFNKIAQNTSLKFIDAKLDREYQLKDILFDLSSIELTQKTLVFLYCKNEVQAVGLYLSLLKSNYAIALLNEELDIRLKQALEKTYSPFIIFDEKRVLKEGFNVEIVHSKVYNYKVFKTTSSCPKIHSNVKVLLSTSGTTGSPKFVKLSEQNLYQNSISICDYLPIINNDVTPLNLPIFYSYGLSILHTNCLNGGEIVCNTDDILNKAFWEQFEQFRFSSIAGVPYVYEMLDRVGFRKKKYDSLRYISQAGGNLNQIIKQKFLDYCIENNLEFYVMYGQTEASPRISYVPPNKLSEKITSIGQSILNGNLTIDSVTQELLYEGPNIFGGYAQKPKDLMTWKKSKHLHTGDIAIKDKDGFYFITGRIKRFVKVFGNRVNLDEIEDFLKRKIEKTNFACIGIKDKNIIIFTEKDITTEDIKNIVVRELKIHSTVIKHRIIDKFPLTSNGKIDYKELQKIYES